MILSGSWTVILSVSWKLARSNLLLHKEAFLKKGRTWVTFKDTLGYQPPVLIPDICTCTLQPCCNLATVVNNAIVEHQVAPQWGVPPTWLRCLEKQLESTNVFQRHGYCGLMNDY